MKALIFLWAALFSTNVLAAPVNPGHVTAELITENASMVPGEAAWIGLRLEMAPHWHTYWRFPGDSGLPTKVKWELPTGWKVSDPHWPLPARIHLPPLVNFGFEHEALIGYRLGVPATAKPGDYEIGGKASWLVCKEECIPESAELKLRVTVKEGAPRPQPWQDLFTRLRQQQPRPLPAGALQAVRVENKRIGLELDEVWLKEPVDFFPLAAQLVKGTAAPTVERLDGKSILWIEKADPFGAGATALPGVLIVGPAREVYEVEATLVQGVVANTDGAVEGGVLLAALFAFLGGVLLNLMPCVFPVLGIKVMSLVNQGGGNKWHARLHGKVYALGVLVSFWILTAVLLLMRGAGESVGWGFQLQSPAFVIMLILLFSLMAANLAGLFEFGGRWMGAGASLAGRDGVSGSFFTGVLAVIVATPCTAPFMGTAIGVVLSQPAWAVLLVFSALGLGLALPFVLLSYQPALLRALPRPGAWMERLKEFFAFPMAATVLWLLWVLGRQIGLDGVMLTMLGLLLVALSIWLRRQFSGSSAWALSWLLLVLGGLVAVAPLKWRAGSAVNSEASATARWQPFSEEAVAKALAAGEPVFVDFTAAWCLTCQVNKNLVLDRAPMQEFFAAKKVHLFRADWTNHDPLITRALERHGRIGVPLYLAYRAGSQEAEVLPQILTADRVREAFP